MSTPLFKNSRRFRKDAGVALITSLLLLFLMSSLLVGFCILLVSNQQLAGSNNDDVTAFYSAEAGLEQMTANLGDLFAQTYSPTQAQINNIQLNPPLITGIQFLNGNGSNGFTITPAATDAFGNPAPTIATIKSGTYAGMTALLTEYTMVVNARTTAGREVKLQRTTQTVGIPMFQFGIFSDTDLSFFPGPNFNFGGRTHTNGNLFLAAGSTLTLADKVDAYKDIIRTNLENGWPTSTNYTGTVQITTQPGGTNYRAMAMNEGSLTGTVGSSANPNWPTISLGTAPTDYNGNAINGKTGAKQLNLGIVTIGSGATQSIDLLRRPLSGEAANIQAERYYSQASLKILLSDDPQDIMNLPCIDGGTQPFDLSMLAVTPDPVTGAPWTSVNYYTPAKNLWNAMKANNVVPLPLAASGSSSTFTSGFPFNIGDGYFQPNGYPIIKGFLKIEEQIAYGNPCGTWKDVTVEVLSYGYVGKNIDPVSQSLDGTTLNPQWAQVPATMETGKAPMWPTVPMTVAPAPIQMAYQNNPALAAGNFTAINSLTSPTGTCLDPHPLAIIRLERIRDNPTSVYYNTGTIKTTAPIRLPFVSTVGEVCGIDPSTVTATTTPLSTTRNAAAAQGGVAGNTWLPQPYDFWPNTLFDTREGTLRDTAMNLVNPARPTLNGVMHYIEVDAKNLASFFGGKIGTLTTSGQSTKDPIVAPNNFLVYVSDRRGNYSQSQTITGGWPPLSYTKDETGEYGWNDLVNSTSSNGCPNNALDTGEDADSANSLFYYGANEQYIHAIGAKYISPNPTPPGTPLPPGQLGLFAGLNAVALQTNATCATVPSYATDGIWPMMVAYNAALARENPALFFRRAIKIVNGSNISAVGTCPGSVNCGLSIATENPTYIQGDFNANFGGIGFGATPTTVAASVAADAVTLLSNNWNDINSFSSPYSTNARSGVTTWYRVAVIGGSTPYFPQPTGTGQDFGTDGGVHNFLRYLEAWNGTLNYEGSIVNLFYSRQANGVFKCCTTVYSPPTRGYNFDTNFLTPALLPPRTPLFRDTNVTGWTRLLEPNSNLNQ
jgi:Tfp pilus assembly protein PilX